MADPAPTQTLSRRERQLAGAAGVVLLVAAVWLVVWSPDRTVVIDGCTPSDGVQCTATVDGDFGTFAAVLVAAAAIAILVALLGLRFTRIKAGGIELEQIAKGLKETSPESPSGTDDVPDTPPDRSLTSDEAAKPMTEQTADELNAERSEIYRRNHGYFMSHVLGRPTRPGQQYRTAIFLVGHRTPVNRDTVESATFFLGEKWGSRPVEGSWSDRGDLGIVTEAFGPFLVVCEVTLKKTGERFRIDHYVDFSHGVLLD
jgi:hypothetical protein